jgi:diacylglycerol O-acyltransferase
MTREKLSGIDRAWLRMEDPTHPMMVTVLLGFDAPIEFGQLQAVVGRRLLRFPRFRQRVVQPREGWDSAAWEDDPSFDLDHHLVWTSHEGPVDEAGLRAVVSELMSKQLDLSKPLWQFHLIEPYGSGCALVGRVHHCLADGPALMHVLLTLTDAEPDASAPVAVPEVSTASVAPVRGVATQVTELLVQQGFDLLVNPLRLWGLARLGSGTMAAVNKLLWRTPDPRTSFKGRLGVSKQAAWSQPVALAEVKAVGQAVGSTVNDVMLAAATGALRRYLVSHGEPVGGLAIRAGLSVNLRPPEAGTSLGNQAGALLVDLPVGVDSALERLQQVKRQMDRLKRSPEAGVVWALLNALGNAPAPVQDALVEAYCTRDTAVVANVPGPAETVYLAGAPLSSLMFWVPALGGAGLCLSIVSYGGQVWFGAGTDEGLVPDPEELMAGFHAEFKALRRATQALAAEQDKNAAREGSIEAMNTMLDEALARVDALLQDPEAETSRGLD